MRGAWAGVLMAAVSTGATAERPAMPALSQQGIARAHVLVLVVDNGPARLKLQAALAEQVRRLAAVHAPVPVDVVGFGDPALLQRDALGILVHVALDRRGPRPLAIVSVRTYRSDPGRSTFFGATPMAVPLGADDRIPDATLATALDQILPWRQAGTPPATIKP